MTRFFIKLRDGTEELLDPEGTDFPSLDALRKAVLKEVRELIGGDAKARIIDLRFRIDVEDVDGVMSAHCHSGTPWTSSLPC